MKHEIAFSVGGVPQSKGSTRSFLDPKSGRVRTWSDNRETLKPWEELVRLMAVKARGRGHALWTQTPVHLDVTFVFARPKGTEGRRRAAHFVKPDLSKLIRGLEDALSGIIYRDDAQIAHVTARKRYAINGETPRADVKVWIEDGDVL